MSGQWLPLIACLAACTGEIGREPPEQQPGVPGEGPPNGRDTRPGTGTSSPGPLIPGVGSPGASSACAKIDPGPAPLRRLTRFEYDNTIRDLLGDDARMATAKFPAEEQVLGFNNNAAALGVTTTLAESYGTAAETLAAKAVTNLPKLLGCDPARGEDTCARSFIETFGRRAYRRPVTAEESTKLGALYTSAKMQFGFKTAVQLVVEAVVQSSAFFYRLETGAPVTGNTTLRRLTPYEVASRLSYLVWASMPDDTLFAAAAASKLSTPAEIKAQATRMLTDRKARAVVGDFADQWLGLDEMRHLGKDPALFPAFTPELAGFMADEVEKFFEFAAWDPAGGFDTLLTGSFGFQNAKLARFIGEANVTGDFQKVTFDPGRRAGLLTQAGMMAMLSAPYETSPIHRGLFVRRKLLCETLPDPPPELMVMAPKVNPNLTTRERFNQHAASPACAGCHALIDPVGLGFERYDAVGRWRTTENNKPVDSSGHLAQTDVEGPFNGGVELAKKLAGSQQVRTCVVRQWFRFGYGRGETEADACSVELLRKTFDESGGRFPDLIVALTQTPAFLYRSAGEGVAP